MTERRSKKRASREDQGLGAEEEHISKKHQEKSRIIKRRSKKRASGEDQGLRAEEESNNNPHTSKKQQEVNMSVDNINVENEKPEVKNKFLKKFTFNDDKKLLRALFKHGYKTATKNFFDEANLKLSFGASQGQVYEKSKYLRNAYLKTLATDSVHRLSVEKLKLHYLSSKIWGMEEEEKEGEKVDNTVEEKKAEEFKQKVDNFHTLISMYKEDDLKAECHVSEALQIAPIPLLQRTGLINSWKKLQTQQSQLLEEKRDFISRITRAVETSPLGRP